MRVFAVVLAAGEGSRMGGNKGLVSFRGRPLVSTVLDAYATSAVAGVTVVTGAEADALDPVVRAGGGVPVQNPEWREGQTSSLRAGLQALPEEIDGFLVHPVDHALVTSKDLDALIAAFSRLPDPAESILRPVCGEIFGHPVLFGTALRDAFLQLPISVPANTIYRDRRDRAILVPVKNPLVGVDLDTPEDLARHDPTG